MGQGCSDPHAIRRRSSLPPTVVPLETLCPPARGHRYPLIQNRSAVPGQRSERASDSPVGELVDVDHPPFRPIKERSHKMAPDEPAATCHDNSSHLNLSHTYTKLCSTSFKGGRQASFGDRTGA